ncbi:MAG: hypothetical protein ACTH52_08910, partial [Lactococcus cremoris]
RTRTRTRTRKTIIIHESSLPRPLDDQFSGYYWKDGMNNTPMPFLQPHVARGFRFKSALRKLSNRAA